MAKYFEMKAESLKKLNCNLGSETARTTQNSQKSIVCIQLSNYPFDMCKFGALFPDNYNKLKRAKSVFCYIPFPTVFNFDCFISFHSRFILTIGKHEVQKEFYTWILGDLCTGTLWCLFTQSDLFWCCSLSVRKLTLFKIFPLPFTATQ